MKENEKILKIEELKKDLYTGDFGDCFCDYDSGYICDIISEIADNKIDLYYDDLFKWAKDNTSWIDDAMKEFGTPEDIVKIIQQGQFLANESELYDNLENSLKLFMYNFIEYTLNIKEITEKQNIELLDFNFSDNNEQLENIIYHTKEVLKDEV